ncbi:MAG: ABC transporter ATP-binding protein [Candidatus Omnitrophota bacterium]
MGNDAAVTVRALEKKFGAFTAVNRVSFEVGKGEIFGFLGPNGAGKSTTIKMLCGIFEPTSGEGTVSGYDIIRQQENIRQNIGYMSQKFSLYADLTVEENIDFYSGIYGIPAGKKKERKEAVIKMAGLGEFRSNLTGLLPGGWKQRLALGCAVIHEPAVIFLDEPTSGVDPITRRNFWAQIKEMAVRGVTVFVTTHYMDEAENCDRLALIYKGSIIAMGTPLELKTDFMKNDVLEIQMPVPEEWLGRLAEINGVNETALFGRKIHAIVDPGEKTLGNIEEFLKREISGEFSLRRIEASLEDVFVWLIEEYDKEKAAA